MAFNARNDIPPARTVYGLDVTPAFVAVVRGRLTRGGVRFETCLDTIPENGDVLGALTSLLDRLHGDVEARRAWWSAALPSKHGSTRWLTAPFPARRKARRVLPALLDVHLPFPLESCIYGFLGLDATSTDGQRALAIAARREAVEQHLAQLAAWKIEPHVLDHEEVACWDYHQQQLPPEHRAHSVVAYLGLDRSVLVAGQQDTVLHTRNTQRALTATLATAWVERASRLLRSAGPAPAAGAIHWYWTGPGAADQAMLAAAESALGQQHRNLVFHHHAEPRTFLARALAQRVLTRSRWAWNFRQGSAAHPAVLRQRTMTQRQAAATVLAAGLALCLLNAGLRYQAGARERAADEALAEWTRRITGQPHVIRGQEVLLAERAIEAQQAGWAPLLQLAQPGALHAWAEVLALAARHQLQFDVITVRPGELQLRGTAPDWDSTERFAAAYRDRGRRVELDQQDITETRRVRFRLVVHDQEEAP